MASSQRRRACGVCALPCALRPPLPATGGRAQARALGAPWRRTPNLSSADLQAQAAAFRECALIATGAKIPFVLPILTDPGFDASVLSKFRTRLLHGGAEHLLLETLLTLLQEHGLLKARGTQRTDSTHILGAIRTLNRLELVGETMRYALNRLAVAAPTWLRAHMQPAWPERYGSRVENDRFPKADAARQRLAATIGAMGLPSCRPRMRPMPPRTSVPPSRWRSSAKSGYSNIMARRTHPAGGKPPTCPLRRS